jgi:hypothetical protein
MPSEERVTLSSKFEKSLSFHELIAARLEWKLRKPAKYERVRAKLPWESLHYDGTGRVRGRFNFLEKQATHSSCLGVDVCVVSKKCSLPP